MELKSPYSFFNKYRNVIYTLVEDSNDEKDIEEFKNIYIKHKYSFEGIDEVVEISFPTILEFVISEYRDTILKDPLFNELLDKVLHQVNQHWFLPELNRLTTKEISREFKYHLHFIQLEHKTLGEIRNPHHTFIKLMKFAKYYSIEQEIKFLLYKNYMFYLFIQDCFKHKNVKTHMDMLHTIFKVSLSSSVYTLMTPEILLNVSVEQILQMAKQEFIRLNPEQHDENGAGEVLTHEFQQMFFTFYWYYYALQKKNINVDGLVERNLPLTDMVIVGHGKIHKGILKMEDYQYQVSYKREYDDNKMMENLYPISILKFNRVQSNDFNIVYAILPQQLLKANEIPPAFILLLFMKAQLNGSKGRSVYVDHKRYKVTFKVANSKFKMNEKMLKSMKYVPNKIDEISLKFQRLLHHIKKTLHDNPEARTLKSSLLEFRKDINAQMANAISNSIDPMDIGVKREREDESESASTLKKKQTNEPEWDPYAYLDKVQRQTQPQSQPKTQPQSQPFTQLPSQTPLKSKSQTQPQTQPFTQQQQPKKEEATRQTIYSTTLCTAMGVLNFHNGYFMDFSFPKEDIEKCQMDFSQGKKKAKEMNVSTLRGYVDYLTLVTDAYYNVVSILKLEITLDDDLYLIHMDRYSIPTSDLQLMADIVMKIDLTAMKKIAVKIQFKYFATFQKLIFQYLVSLQSQTTTTSIEPLFQYFLTNLLTKEGLFAICPYFGHLGKYSPWAFSDIYPFPSSKKVYFGYEGIREQYEQFTESIQKNRITFVQQLLSAFKMSKNPELFIEQLFYTITNTSDISVVFLIATIFHHSKLFGHEFHPGILLSHIVNMKKQSDLIDTLIAQMQPAVLYGFMVKKLNDLCTHAEPFEGLKEKFYVIHTDDIKNWREDYQKKYYNSTDEKRWLSVIQSSAMPIGTDQFDFIVKNDIGTIEKMLSNRVLWIEKGCKHPKVPVDQQTYECFFVSVILPIKSEDPNTVDYKKRFLHFIARLYFYFCKIQREQFNVLEFRERLENELNVHKLFNFLLREKRIDLYFSSFYLVPRYYLYDPLIKNIQKQATFIAVDGEGGNKRKTIDKGEENEEEEEEKEEKRKFNKKNQEEPNFNVDKDESNEKYCVFEKIMADFYQKVFISKDLRMNSEMTSIFICLVYLHHDIPINEHELFINGLLNLIGRGPPGALDQLRQFVKEQFKITTIEKSNFMKMIEAFKDRWDLVDRMELDDIVLLNDIRGTEHFEMFTRELIKELKEYKSMDLALIKPKSEEDPAHLIWIFANRFLHGEKLDNTIDEIAAFFKKKSFAKIDVWEEMRFMDLLKLLEALYKQSMAININSSSSNGIDQETRKSLSLVLIKIAIELDNVSSLADRLSNQQFTSFFDGIYINNMFCGSFMEMEKKTRQYYQMVGILQMCITNRCIPALKKSTGGQVGKKLPFNNDAYQAFQKLTQDIFLNANELQQYEKYMKQPKSVVLNKDELKAYEVFVKKKGQNMENLDMNSDSNEKINQYEKFTRNQEENEKLPAFLESTQMYTMPKMFTEEDFDFTRIFDPTVIDEKNSGDFRESPHDIMKELLRTYSRLTVTPKLMAINALIDEYNVFLCKDRDGQLKTRFTLALYTYISDLLREQEPPNHEFSKEDIELCDFALFEYYPTMQKEIVKNEKKTKRLGSREGLKKVQFEINTHVVSQAIVTVYKVFTENMGYNVELDNEISHIVLKKAAKMTFDLFEAINVIMMKVNDIKIATLDSENNIKDILRFFERYKELVMIPQDYRNDIVQTLLMNENIHNAIQLHLLSLEPLEANITSEGITGRIKIETLIKNVIEIRNYQLEALKMPSLNVKNEIQLEIDEIKSEVNQTVLVPTQVAIETKTEIETQVKSPYIKETSEKSGKISELVKNVLEQKKTLTNAEMEKLQGERLKNNINKTVITSNLTSSVDPIKVNVNSTYTEKNKALIENVVMETEISL